MPPSAPDTATAAPLISQIAVLPLPSRQTMSLLPSPSKSPVPTTDHARGTLPTLTAEATWVPFMNQIEVLPLLSRHNRSLMPSPSKSPAPTSDHGAGTLPNPPSSYLKKIYVDTVVFTPNQLAALVDTFGADHVLMGTDYPYDMAEYDPLEHLVATKSLDASAVAAIAGGNARKLLGI